MIRSFSDMMGRRVEIGFPPKRIISLVPSQTELLYDLGLDEEVIGITKFCVHPEPWFRSKQRIGGTKQLHLDKIRELLPDLIIANKEENTKAQIDELAKEFPVWISDIRNINEALIMIRSVGQLVGKESNAETITGSIEQGFKSLQQATIPKRVAYFIWYEPWMCAGSDTFINSVIHTIGWKNVLEDQLRYPELTLEALKELRPQLVLLSSEPFPFKEKHVAEIKAILPDAEVKLVDGEMFSWYGSRMLKAIHYLSKLVSAE